MPDFSMEYLAELLKEKRQLAYYGNAFTHVERLIDQEISRVRAALFQTHFKKEELDLPEPEGDVTVMQEKVYVPAKEHLEYNFVGRILGPRGMTAKQLELDTECKIMIRGRGSLRDRKKEELMRGKPTWEHLDDDLHVLIQCEDTPNRAKVKLENAVKQVKKLLVPTAEGMDELKRKQLMELAIINGTYRPANKDRDQFKPIIPPNIIRSLAMVSPIRTPNATTPYFMPQSPSPIGQPILGAAYSGSPITPANQRSTLSSNYLPPSPPNYEFGGNLAHLMSGSPLTTANQQNAFSFSYAPPSPPNYDYDGSLSQLMSKFNRFTLESPHNFAK
uniref:K Homology domain-containing protein n=1 Tax=Acrobeloides nanus TaxID=290746 RepID=A0A914BXK3_9BILA